MLNAISADTRIMKNDNDFVIQCEGNVNRLYEEIHTLNGEEHSLCKVELAMSDSILHLVAPCSIYNSLVEGSQVYVEYARESKIILYVEVVK